MTKADLRRFWSKVDVRGLTECWPWKASISTWGYGSFWLDGRNINASQAAYLFGKGPTDGLSVLHRCDNPPCCNPGHLFLGTQGDNVRDCQRKGRGRGHFTNVKVHPRYSAKLNPEIIAEAKRLYATGVSQVELGKRYGVHSSTMSRAIRGEKWAHLA